MLRPRSIRNKNKQRWNTGSNPLAQSENLDAPTGFEDEWEEAKSIGEESTNELMDMITPIATDFGNHSSCDFSKVKFQSIFGEKEAPCQMGSVTHQYGILAEE